MSTIRTIYLIFFIIWGSSLATQVAPLSDHPRLFLTDSGLEGYRQRLRTDSILAGVSGQLLRAADGLIDLPVQHRAMVGRRLLRASRTVLKRVLLLGYAYRLTGEDKYFERGRSELLSAAGYSDYNPSHFLDVAEMVTALAIGYDWFYARLSPADRDSIEAAAFSKALLPGLRDPGWWLTTNNNWNQVCNGGLAVGAIAFYEAGPSVADSLIRRSATNIDRALEQYAPDGAYAEGASYYEYGTSYHALFLDAYLANFPDRPSPTLPDYFINSGDFMVQLRGPTGYYNYGDSRAGDRPFTSIFWMAQATGNTDILFYQSPLLDSVASGALEVPVEGDGLRIFPLIPIWLSRLPASFINVPESTDFFSGGMNPVAALRTGYAEDATFLAFKGGTPSMNHGHMDIGSFVLDRNGHRWVMDGGMHDYTVLEQAGLQIFDRSQGGDRWRVNRYTNFSHSTLVADGQPQRVEGFAPLEQLELSKGWRGGRVVMDSVYAGQLLRSRRTLALHNSGAVVISDQVAAGDQRVDLRWAILTGDDLIIRSPKEAILFRGSDSLLVEILQPSAATFTTYSTRPEHPAERPIPNTVMLGFELTLLPGEQQHLAVLLSTQESIRTDRKRAQQLLRQVTNPER